MTGGFSISKKQTKKKKKQTKLIRTCEISNLI